MNKTKLLWTALGIVLVAGLIWVMIPAPTTQAPQGAPESQSQSPGADQANPQTGGPTPTQSGTSGGNTATKPLTIYLSSPSAGERWLLGETNTISWTNPAKITGEIILVQAGTKTVVGWINSTTGADQTSFSWDTRSVYVSRGGGTKKDIAPGDYFIRVKFDSASYPVLESGIIAITIIAPAAETRTVTIQNYAFNPANTIVSRGGKVTFRNNDGMKHNVTFESTVYPVSHLDPGASAIIDTTGFPPGTYKYYCSLHPTMKGVLTVQ